MNMSVTRGFGISVFRSVVRSYTNGTTLCCGALNSRAEKTRPLCTQSTRETKNESDNSGFSGFIPMEKMEKKYVKSSGPGGQHVNKVNTKVQLGFHVQTADWLSADLKEKIVEKLSKKITKDGYLYVESDKTRKQILNQADCMEKIRGLLRYASQTKREPTDDEIALYNRRKEKARQGILREKRNHSMNKHQRKAPTSDSL